MKYPQTVPNHVVYRLPRSLRGFTSDDMDQTISGYIYLVDSSIANGRHDFDGTRWRLRGGTETYRKPSSSSSAAVDGLLEQCVLLTLMFFHNRAGRHLGRPVSSSFGGEETPPDAPWLQTCSSSQTGALHIYITTISSSFCRVLASWHRCSASGPWAADR